MIFPQSPTSSFNYPFLPTLRWCKSNKFSHRKLCLLACAIPTSKPNKLNEKVAKNLVVKGFKNEFVNGESQESSIKMGSNFTNFQQDPIVDKLRTQLAIAITYQPLDPWFESGPSLTKLFTQTENANFKSHDSIIKTGEDLLYAPAPATPPALSPTPSDLAATPPILAATPLLCRHRSMPCWHRLMLWLQLHPPCLQGFRV
ncbi:hypothetical protein V6N11_073691 [Hibiscus sabdariffa]|uniref:Uncharacterized protein n=1 Tax=Hibiscus sabdariffa TaxID=183260 RepID=A0ABR2NU72_9ROSI